MINEKHYVGEVGTVVWVDCGIAVDDATGVTVEIERPDGTVVSKAAVPETYNGSDNYVRFSIEAGDLNQAGDFKCQVKLTLGPWTGRGAEFTISVDEPASSSSSSSRSSSSSST